MSAINRREFVKFAAGLPLLNLAGPLIANGSASVAGIDPADSYQDSYQGQTVLDIFLHGMFAVHFIDDAAKKIHQVALYPPHVEGINPHAYFASDLVGNSPQFVTLTRGSSYSFDFCGADTIPPISEFTNVVVQLSGNVQRDTNQPAHCQIALPMPHHVIPLKAKISKIAGQPLFTKYDALLGGSMPLSIPLVTVLRYDLGTNELGWNQVLKYHFFAEPEVCPRDFHTSEALNELRKLYKGLSPQNLEFNTCLGPGDLLDIPEAPGGEFSSNDERALVDILHPNPQCMDLKPCSPPHPMVQPKIVKPRSHTSKAGGPGPSGTIGVHPTACMSVMFVPS